METPEPTTEEIRVNPIKGFITRHKVGITVAITSAAWIAINRYALHQHDEFLKEHDLYDEFYLPEEDEL